MTSTRAAADAWLRQLELEDAAGDAPLRTDHLTEVLGSYAAGTATTSELRDATARAVAVIERDAEIHRAIVSAWHRRGSTTLFDGLWSAACWCASAAGRTTSAGRAADFARAREIVAGDPEAARAVQDVQGRPARTVVQGGGFVRRERKWLIPR